MIKRSITLFNIKKPDFSSKNKSGFFIANKKTSLPMGKRKNNLLSSFSEDEILDVVYNTRKQIVPEQIFSKKQYGETLLKKVSIKCKNQRQKEYLNMIDEKEIVICVGESGVGKSYLSIAKALELLKDSSKGYDKIFIITPIVESEDNIGFLKGTLSEKLDPYLYSVYYLIDKIVGEDTRRKLVESEIVSPLCISYLRGVNIDNAILISDETQNMTIKGIKTLLTRIGFNSKFILSGDINQIDRFKNENDSGLKYAYENLGEIEGVGLFEFTKEDIVRNKIIGEILDRFKPKQIEITTPVVKKKREKGGT
jgi:phosphate starvation-inducible protein PhoH and related proteins